MRGTRYATPRHAPQGCYSLAHGAILCKTRPIFRQLHKKKGTAGLANQPLWRFPTLSSAGTKRAPSPLSELLSVPGSRLYAHPTEHQATRSQVRRQGEGREGGGGTVVRGSTLPRTRSEAHSQQQHALKSAFALSCRFCPRSCGIQT